MKLGRWIVAGAVVMTMLGAGPVTAKDGLYVGGSLGQTTLKINDLDLDHGESSSGIEVRAAVDRQRIPAGAVGRSPELPPPATHAGLLAVSDGLHGPGSNHGHLPGSI